MNVISVVGRLGRDAEMRYTNSGTAVANFTLAVDRRGKGQDGEKNRDALWLKVVLWGKVAEALTQYLKKGKQVAVSGELDIREWNDREGQKRQSVEIVGRSIDLLGGGDKRESKPADEDSNTGSPINDEDIPF